MSDTDPYKSVRRDIPPPDFKFGKNKYSKQDRKRMKEMVDAEIDRWLEEDEEQRIEDFAMSKEEVEEYLDKLFKNNELKDIPPKAY